MSIKRTQYLLILERHLFFVIKELLFFLTTEGSSQTVSTLQTVEHRNVSNVYFQLPFRFILQIHRHQLLGINLTSLVQILVSELKLDIFGQKHTSLIVR